MEIIICLILLYFLPVLLTWFYVRLAFGKNGVRNGDEIEKDVFIFIFCPIGNIIFSFVAWLFHYPIKKEKKRKKIL